MKMDWKKTILYGIAIWVIGFVVGSILMLMTATTSWLFAVLMLVIMAVVVWVMAGKIEMANRKIAIAVGIIWLAIALILDYLVTSRFAAQSGTIFFASWPLWIGYALTLVLPAVRMSMSK